MGTDGTKISRNTASEHLPRLAREYFINVDRGDPALLGMFTDDATVYFPKYGFAHGKQQIVEFVTQLTTAVIRFRHPQDQMTVMQQGSRVVVEGVEEGELAGGVPFPGQARSGGRMCNVFEFEGSLIKRLHIYTDPDFAGQYQALFEN